MSEMVYVDGSVYSSSEFAAYASAIRGHESTDTYNIPPDSTNGHLGAYQLGYNVKNPALQDAGFIDANKNWTPLAKSLGVNSVATFLSNHRAQDIAFQNYTEKNSNYIQSDLSYAGKTIDGIYLTEAGLLAGAHLVGHVKLTQFLTSNGAVIPTDTNGTKITQYLSVRPETS